MQPGKQSFDFPAPFGAASRTAILGGHAAAPAMPRDHFNAVVLPELRIERVAVVAAIADQSFWKIGEESEIEGRRDEVRLIR